MITDKLLLMLGLATRARKISHGSFLAEDAIKKGKAYLAIVASDASNNTKKSFKDACTYYNVPLMIYSNAESISKICGKTNIVVLTVNDNNFASEITKIYDLNLTGGEYIG